MAKKQTATYLEDPLREWLETESEAQGRTVAGHLRYLVLQAKEESMRQCSLNSGGANG